MRWTSDLDSGRPYRGGTHDCEVPWRGWVWRCQVCGATWLRGYWPTWAVRLAGRIGGWAR